MQYHNDDKVDPHGTKTKETSLSMPSPVMKRTPRMMYESSFATSAFTSIRNQQRPPGFLASSLDFALSATDSTIEQNIVTVKPGKNKKIINKQKEEEQLQREKQYQQQRQFRPGHPTRAQGNFGPPPPSTRSLEDLENMSEEEIYKLFMDDPEFQEALLKTAATPEQTQNVAPSSAPAGAKKGSRSTGRKTSNSSKSKRSNDKSKTLKSTKIQREIPYFQWSFLFILMGAAIYKIYRSQNISTTAKGFCDTSKKVISRKNKKKKRGKLRIKTSGKTIVSEQQVQPIEKEEDIKKMLPRRKRKKKASVIRPTRSSSAGNDKRNENDQTQKQDQKHEPDLDTADGSSRKNVTEIAAKFDLAMQMNSGSTSSAIAEKDEEDWKTVTKSSKGGRKGNTNVDQNILDQQSSENIVEDGDVKLDEKTAECKILGKQLNEDSKIYEKEEENNKLENESSPKKPSSKNEIENSSAAQTITLIIDQASQSKNGDKLAQTITLIIDQASQSKNGDKPVSDVGNNGEYAENDAALALKLQEEEENLARAANGNPQEEVWEEVTIKKKRGI